MSNQFLDQPRRTRTYVIAATLGLLAFVAVGLCVQAALTPKKPENFNPPTLVPAVGAFTGLNTQGNPASGHQGPLRLVRGANLVNGMYVGYPHTPVGAVSAAVEFWTQIGSTLDPDRAAAVGRLVADPAWTNAPAALAQGPVNTRQGLGLSAAGQVPAGASVVLDPVQYQIKTQSTDQVSVLLLCDYTTTTPNAGSQTRIGVFPITVHWAAADWKLVDTTGDTTDYSSLSVIPDSSQATADGWQDLTR
jgi:hypothetical protein